MKKRIKAPEHLDRDTAKWFEEVAAEFVLEAHHLRLLQAAGETWDRMQAARRAIAEHGLVYTDRFGQPHSRPEVSIERDAKIGFARLVRELGFDVKQPGESRPPRIGGQQW